LTRSSRRILESGHTQGDRLRACQPGRLVALGSQEGQDHVDALDLADPAFDLGAGNGLPSADGKGPLASP